MKKIVILAIFGLLLAYQGSSVSAMSSESADIQAAKKQLEAQFIKDRDGEFREEIVKRDGKTYKQSSRIKSPFEQDIEDICAGEIDECHKMKAIGCNTDEYGLRDGDGIPCRPLLFLAALYGKEKYLNYLLKYTPKKLITELIDETDVNGQTALHAAAYKGHMAVFNKLREVRKEMGLPAIDNQVLRGIADAGCLSAFVEHDKASQAYITGQFEKNADLQAEALVRMYNAQNWQKKQEKMMDHLYANTERPSRNRSTRGSVEDLFQGQESVTASMGLAEIPKSLAPIKNELIIKNKLVKPIARRPNLSAGFTQLTPKASSAEAQFTQPVGKENAKDSMPANSMSSSKEVQLTQPADTKQSIAAAQKIPRKKAASSPRPNGKKRKRAEELV